MPPPCSRCVSQRVINLETARKLGIAAGALAGTLKGAYTSLSLPGRPSLPTPSRFPLTRIGAAVIGATTGGIAGAVAGHRLFQHITPPGTGTPWLCLGCGHAFRVPD